MYHERKIKGRECVIVIKMQNLKTTDFKCFTGCILIVCILFFQSAQRCNVLLEVLTVLPEEVTAFELCYES